MNPYCEDLFLAQKMAGIVLKTVALALLKRLSSLSYVFEPTSVGMAALTEMVISSPENFTRFLEISTASVCRCLSMSGSESDTLWDLTDEIWVQLSRPRL